MSIIVSSRSRSHQVSTPSLPLALTLSTSSRLLQLQVVAVALRKLQMGAMPDVEGQLSSFLGMPSSCRKSVLAPLDHIKELSLQWVLMPKLDSRGCIQVCNVYVRTRWKMFLLRSCLRHAEHSPSTRAAMDLCLVLAGKLMRVHS